jgi:hypothetical protein
MLTVQDDMRIFVISSCQASEPRFAGNPDDHGHDDHSQNATSTITAMTTTRKMPPVRQIGDR